jgi:hypothetical protein
MYLKRTDTDASEKRAAAEKALTKSEGFKLKIMTAATEDAKGCIYENRNFLCACFDDIEKTARVLKGKTVNKAT